VPGNPRKRVESARCPNGGAGVSGDSRRSEVVRSSRISGQCRPLGKKMSSTVGPIPSCTAEGREGRGLACGSAASPMVGVIMSAALRPASGFNYTPRQFFLARPVVPADHESRPHERGWCLVFVVSCFQTPNPTIRRDSARNTKHQTPNTRLGDSKYRRVWTAVGFVLAAWLGERH